MSVANIEKEKGVSGFTDTQEELERVSALKGDLDIKKAASLEEMSKMVTKLKDRFEKGLAPFVRVKGPCPRVCPLTIDLLWMNGMLLLTLTRERL